MKILVLHGYTQSGPCFQKKIKKLESHLGKAFRDASFYYPTAPIQLKPSEMLAAAGAPQLKPDDDDKSPVQSDKADIDDIDCHAWFRLHDHNDPPEGFLRSLEFLSNYLREHGPFDGVIGFSQGGLMAIMVASLLEGDARREAFEREAKVSPETLPFPESFEDMKHPPFKFGITYGALMGVTKRYAPFYENPRIQTPFCQFSGQWDPVVTVEMVDAVNRAHIGGDRSLKVVHPGAHAVCTERKYLDTVVDFINGVESYSMPLPSELESQELLIEHEILELASSGSVTSERSIPPSMKLLSINSTPPSSDDLLFEAKHTKRRNMARKVKGRRKSSLNRIHINPLYSHGRSRSRSRSDDSSSDLTAIDTLSMDGEPNKRNFHEQRQRLSDALDIFLTEWKQIEELQGFPPSLLDTQEMAARILRMNML